MFFFTQLHLFVFPLRWQLPKLRVYLALSKTGNNLNTTKKCPPSWNDTIEILACASSREIIKDRDIKPWVLFSKPPLALVWRQYCSPSTQVSPRLYISTISSLIKSTRRNLLNFISRGASNILGWLEIDIACENTQGMFQHLLFVK